MSKFADLHIHTHFSDSTDSPEEVVAKAKKEGLCCISITDHDTIDAIIPARAAAQNDLEVITGVELSTEIDGKDIHILAYLFDLNSPELLNVLQKAQETRVKRVGLMIEKLQGLGFKNISVDEVLSLSHSKSVGRPHLAFLLKQKGWVSSIYEAFNKYLGENCPAYVPKYKLSPVDAIDVIRKSGGLSVLAHPIVTGKDELIPQLVEAGLSGIEIYYPNYPETAINHYNKIAQKHNLLVTGGSDAHGAAKENTYIGKARIPYEYVERLKDAASKIKSR